MPAGAGGRMFVLAAGLAASQSRTEQYLAGPANAWVSSQRTRRQPGSATLLHQSAVGGSRT
ncbi:hypothetical protein LZ32DRAFT_598261 [Colletotrichum eremochloae]|nr:hypothetical protein LZ32DRAFT_598261 [Colletotrichum eremochloae]